MTKVFNRTSEKQKRRALRGSMPKAEVILWSRLKGRGLKGYKFRRQYGIGEFITDFYCPELKLAVEVDGDSHFKETSEKRDGERQRYMESYGITFLRFTNTEIYECLDGVLERISMFLPDRPPLTPPCKGGINVSQWDIKSLAFQAKTSSE